ELGIPGRQSLDRLWSQAFAGDRAHLEPTIGQFRTDNGIILPSLRAMLPLLSLLGVRSLEFHQSVMGELRDKLLERIEEMATKPTSDEATVDEQHQQQQRSEKLKQLLQKSFPLVHIPMLEPVVM